MSDPPFLETTMFSCLVRFTKLLDLLGVIWDRFERKVALVVSRFSVAFTNSKKRRTLVEPNIYTLSPKK